MPKRFNADLAIGSPVRVGPGGYTRTCIRCGGPVYLRDEAAYNVGKAACLECFVVLLEEHPDDEKLTLMLPPGVTPASFLAFMKGETKSPYTS